SAREPRVAGTRAWGGDPAQAPPSLRSLGGETGAEIPGSPDLVGNRLVDGFDIAEPTALELPDALVRAISIAVYKEPQATSDDSGITKIRAQVPADHREESDQLPAEPRPMYRLPTKRRADTAI